MESESPVGTGTLARPTSLFQWSIMPQPPPVVHVTSYDSGTLVFVQHAGASWSADTFSHITVLSNLKTVWEDPGTWCSLGSPKPVFGMGSSLPASSWALPCAPTLPCSQPRFRLNLGQEGQHIPHIHPILGSIQVEIGPSIGLFCHFEVFCTLMGSGGSLSAKISIIF